MAPGLQSCAGFHYSTVANTAELEWHQVASGGGERVERERERERVRGREGKSAAGVLHTGLGFKMERVDVRVSKHHSEMSSRNTRWQLGGKRKIQK